MGVLSKTLAPNGTLALLTARAAGRLVAPEGAKIGCPYTRASTRIGDRRRHDG